MKLQHIREKSIETHNGENVYKQRNSNILQMRTKINIYDYMWQLTIVQCQGTIKL